MLKSKLFRRCIFHFTNTIRHSSHRLEICSNDFSNHKSLLIKDNFVTPEEELRLNYLITQQHLNITEAVHEESLTCLQFKWENRLYQYTTMPFGLNINPFVFNKIMKRPISILRGWGVRLILYLDDMFVFMSITRNRTYLHHNNQNFLGS